MVLLKIRAGSFEQAFYYKTGQQEDYNLVVNRNRPVYFN